MNWDAISFDWNQVRAFLATAETGSFSGAARALKTTQPTIGRQVAELERKLGVVLFERSVRGPHLTDAGRDMLSHVQAMGEAASLISMTATAHAQDVSGLVTVTATDLMTAEILPDLLTPLRASNPGIRMNLLASNDVQNILKREADIAIRHVRPDQPELIARHVGDFHAGLFAATQYLNIKGRPKTPREVAEHDFVGNPDPVRLIAPMHQLGIPLRPENFVISSDSGTVVWNLVQQGMGISVLPEALCGNVANIERVLPDLPSFQFPIWLVTHRELQTSRRIRIVFDLLARGLKQATRQAG